MYHSKCDLTERHTRRHPDGCPAVEPLAPIDGMSHIIKADLELEIHGGLRLFIDEHDGNAQYPIHGVVIPHSLFQQEVDADVRVLWKVDELALHGRSDKSPVITYIQIPHFAQPIPVAGIVQSNVSCQGSENPSELTAFPQPGMADG